jgi:hypothetical protein
MRHVRNFQIPAGLIVRILKCYELEKIYSPQLPGIVHLCGSGRHSADERPACSDGADADARCSHAKLRFRVPPPLLQ